MVVDGPGDQLLSGAALAADQGARLGRGDEGDALEHGLQRRARADDGIGRRVGLHSERRRCRRARAAIECPPGGAEGLRQIERLGQIIECAALHGLDRGVQVPMSGDDHDRCRRRDRLQAAECGEAIHARQANVEEDHLGR